MLQHHQPDPALLPRRRLDTDQLLSSGAMEGPHRPLKPAPRAPRRRALGVACAVAAAALLLALGA